MRRTLGQESLTEAPSVLSSRRSENASCVASSEGVPGRCWEAKAPGMALDESGGLIPCLIRWPRASGKIRARRGRSTPQPEACRMRRQPQDESLSIVARSVPAEHRATVVLALYFYLGRRHTHPRREFARATEPHGLLFAGATGDLACPVLAFSQIQRPPSPSPW